MDKLQAMQVFRRIVEANSLSRAAETLGLPASSVTTLLKNLEAELGVRLLQRTTRKLSLTPEGADYLQHVRRILDDVESLEARFPGRTGTPCGQLRVGVAMSLGRRILLPRLAAFRERYPDIALTLRLGDRMIDLVEEGLGCALRTGTPPDSATLVARRLGAFGWTTCASPAYLARYGEPRDVQALGGHECIGYALSRGGRVLDWEFVDAGDTLRFAPRGRLLVNDAESYVDCAVAGLGIVRAGSYLVNPRIEAGELVPLLTQYASPPVPVCVVYAKNRHLAPAVRAFIDWASELFAHDPQFRE